MTYAIADIHGRLDRYQAMLEMIRFSGEDELYIIGDVIDRGPDGVKILKDVMGRANVHMLMGNHEMMAAATFRAEFGRPQQFSCWMRNGGKPTFGELLFRTEMDVCNQIIDFMHGLPTEAVVEVNGRKFHLVHAFPADRPYDRVWTRPALDTPNPFSDRTLVIGHTPVMYLHGETREEVTGYVNSLRQRGEHFKMEHAPGFIDIDCGCASTLPEARLACLRLDDMEEFYA